MVELIPCQLDELVLVAVCEKRIRLLVGDQLLELLEFLGNLLDPCVNLSWCELCDLQWWS